MVLESINPATGERLAEYEEHSPSRVAEMAEAAHAAFLIWRETTFVDRASRLLRAARVLRQNRESFAELMAREMGKPFAQGSAEIEKCIIACEYFADYGEGFLATEHIRTEAHRSYVVLQPLGVVLAVMPWNFPFWQVFRAAIPALMAGNAVILKHASIVSGCARACEEIFRNAGFPEGLFQSVLVGSRRVAELVGHARVKAVTLTGSTAAGESVAAQAGSLLKKTVLELGGSDPYLVLADADVAKAAEMCVASRLINSGQSCIAAKRFIVVERVKREFEDHVVHAMRKQKMGDPLAPDTTIGPVARFDLRDELVRQLQQSLAEGAHLLFWGELPSGPGAFFPPAVLTDVRKGMAAYDEETFGPLAAIIGVADEAEAIRVANDTSFGLGAAVFTRNLERGEHIAQQLEAGCVFVNDFVRSDSRLPFGGVKRSGYGRELASFGIREFVNVKTVWVK
ncbi:MAG: NAD-dependent succinate-semialdehyde dehydrogenase [Verrucomicrobia bacterium]|nr:NAD-dependent succinate-semialdehyde dehydrogenase [Verrucomicrobiota bacterium]